MSFLFDDLFDVGGGVDLFDLVSGNLFDEFEFIARQRVFVPQTKIRVVISIPDASRVSVVERFGLRHWDPTPTNRTIIQG